MAKIQSSVPVSVLHNDLHGLNLGDYLHLTATEKAKFDNLNDLMHTIGNESFTGIKSSINTGASQINGFTLTNNGTGFGSQVIRVNNNSTGLGLLTDNQGTGYGIYANNGGLGYGIASYNYSNGIGIQNYNQTGGIGLVLDASPIATNYLFQGRSNGTPTSSLTKAGDFTANSFIKSGGTSSQFLKADGSVDTNTYLLSSDNYWTKTGVDLQNNNTGHVQVKLQSGKQFQVLNSSGVIQTYIDDIGNARFGNTTQYTQVGISSNIHLRLIRAQATVDFINGNPGISQAFAITTTNTYGMNYQTGSGSVSSSEHFFTIGGVSGSSVLSDGIFRISTSRLLSTVPSKYATDLSGSYDDRTLIDKGYLDSRITGISGFVPYTGANANVNLGEYGLSAGNIQFDLTPTQPLSVGQLRWNDIDGTLEFLMKGGNVTQQIGQELPILVKHADNTGLTNGFVVYTVGSDGNNNTVRYAIATSDLTSSTTFGVMTEDAIGGAKAFCTTFGMVRGINTLALVEGSAVWLSATVAGGLTTTKPIAPNHSVYIGVCVKSHATEGVIFVNISNGYELGELHDVLTTNPLNNEGLFFDSATNLWKNESITSALGYTPYNATNPSGYTTNLGTVTSVSALALGTTGTDLNSSVSNGTTTPVITLNVPTASASNRGALSSSDWINFNSAYNNSITNLTIDYGAFVTNLILTKQNSSTIELGLIAGSATLGDIIQFNGTNLAYVPTTVSAPLSYIPNSNSFSISQANTSTNGYISFSDWNLFNNKQSALSGTGFVKSTAGVISYDTNTYLTSLTGISAGGELSGTYPNPTVLNSAVIGKVLTGVNITGGSISAADSILTAFGKLQNQVNSLLGGSIYQSVWNASTNSPALTSSVGTKGYYYIVSVAGTTNLNGITDWKVGDWAIYDGTSWQKVDNTDAVSSVNGFTGSVSLTTANITENTNLYYTDSRSRNAISLTTTGNSGSSTYSSVTGVLNVPNYTLAGLGGAPSAGGTGYIQNQNISAQTADMWISGVGKFGGNLTLTGSNATLIGGTTADRLIVGNSGITAYGVYYGSAHATTPDLVYFQGSSVKVDTLLSVTGAAIFNSSTTASSFIKSGGTSSQFLKADGSIDSSTYLTSTTGVTTFSAGTTGLTPSTATSGAVTLAGTLNVLNGGTGSTTASGARTNLGATTVGGNVFTSANPTAITFLRANADNTVSWLDATTFRTAIGAGTSTVTPSALTKTDDTNVTLTLGGTPATALLQGVSLTLGWTGTLADGRIASATNWNSKQAGSTNLTSLSSLSYVSTSFVKMTALGTFALDTNSYYLSTNPSGYTSNAGTVISVGGTGTVSGLTLSGTVTSSGNLTLGGTLAVTASNFASQTANTVLAAPDSVNGVPTFRTLTLADLPGAWVKKAVGCATTAALTINTAQTTIDGVTLTAAMRVLIKDQAAPAQNGIYTGVTTTTWVRAVDANDSGDLAGAAVAVDAGTVNGGMTFDCDFKSTDTLGTTAMNWSRVLDRGYLTTVGNSFATLANPSAITFPRINADNTVSTLDAATFRTAIGAGTSTVTPAALTRVNDTNVTLTLGGTPTTALLQATSITVGWTGTLADARIASAATWNAKQNALTNPVTGSGAGTTNYLPKFNGVNSITNSTIYDNGTSVGINTASPNAAAELEINGNITHTAPAATSTSGEIVFFGTGTGLTAGDLYYLSTALVWTACNAGAASTSTGMLAIALGTTVASGMLVKGMARFGTTPYTGATSGQILYASTTAGSFSGTAPTGTTQTVRVIGYCIAAGTTIYFNPDPTWITLV